MLGVGDGLCSGSASIFDLLLVRPVGVFCRLDPPLVVTPTDPSGIMPGVSEIVWDDTDSISLSTEYSDPDSSLSHTFGIYNTEQYMFVYNYVYVDIHCKYPAP